MLVRMIDQGLNAVRLDFTDGGREAQTAALDCFRAAQRERPSSNCAVMMDTAGLQFHIGAMVDQKPIQIKADQSLEIHSDPALEGTDTAIACSCPILPQIIKEGNLVYIDRNLACEVTKIYEVS